jgi:hypothetical protein
VRLKTNQFNSILMSYFRSICREEFGVNRLQTVLLTKPVSIEYELHCLKYYQELVRFCLLTLEREATLFDDIKALKTCKDWSMRMALTYRAEKKKILRNQLELLDMVKMIL